MSRGWDDDEGYGRGGNRKNSDLFASPEDYDNNVQAISDTIRQIASNVGQMQQLSGQIGKSNDSRESRQRM